jgi:hypothetical protein
MFLARDDMAVPFHRTIAIFDLQIIEQIGNRPRRFNRTRFTVELNFHVRRFPRQFWLVCGKGRVANCIGTPRDVNPLEGLFSHESTAFILLISEPQPKARTPARVKKCAYAKIRETLHFRSPQSGFLRNFG